MIVLLARFSAGRMGAETIWNRLPAAYPDFRFEKLGELSVERVSHYLRNLSFEHRMGSGNIRP